MLRKRGLIGLSVVLLSLSTMTIASPTTTTDILESLAAQDPPIAAQHNLINISQHRDTWLATGIEAKKGDHISLVAEGAWDAGLGRPLEPKNSLWIRIGQEGPATNLRQNSQTFIAKDDGAVEVLLRPVGFFELEVDPAGNTRTPVPAWAESPVDMSVLTINWGGDEAHKTGKAHAWVHTLLKTHHSPTPKGFTHLHFLSDSNSFSPWSDEKKTPGIKLNPKSEVGIIRKPVDIPLTDETEISFDWRYLNLPALGDERLAEHHDYTSIAVEFDNGQDFTWMRATTGEPDTIYACPLPGWQEREIHMILQSGKDGLGDWQTHKRRVLADYQAGPAPLSEPDAPTKIVAVWFIANTVFSGGEAETYFKNVTLTSDEGTVDLF